MEIVWKNVGETPLEAVERLRALNPDYKNEKLGYAGRLDPMAEGVLLVLVGEENKNQEKYFDLEKGYEFVGLLGLETDSYDILGLAEFVSGKIIPKEVLKEWIKNLVGKRSQTYPNYSSPNIKNILKKRNASFLGKLKNFFGKVPEERRGDIEIYESEFLGYESVKLSDLREEILSKISLVKGDFRQSETAENWEKIFEKHGKENFVKFRARIKCSGGTYVRSLVHELGESLGTGTIALGIKRTRVGEFTFQDEKFSSRSSLCL